MHRFLSGRTLLLSFTLLALLGAVLTVPNALAGLAVSLIPERPKLDVSAAPPPPSPRVPAAPPQVSYEVRAGLEGEIFPVFANHASLNRAREAKWSTVSVRVSNPGAAPVHNRVIVELPGWSDPEVQSVEIGPGETRVLLFSPSFGPRLFANRSLIAATAVVTVTGPSGVVLHSSTQPVRLRPAEDMYWGSGFRYASFIASWVTPHDPMVEQVLRRAKEFVPGRRLPGYEPWKTAAQQERSTRTQVRAIYRALQQSGVSYVKSSTTFGGHEKVTQRVRLPGASLEQSSANCIDGVVMYASLFENLGMDPVIALVPGHAYVGVRLSPKSERYLWLDTVLTGRGSFEAAVSTAEKGMARLEPAKIRRIEVAKARNSGIFPMPVGGAAATPAPRTAGAALHRARPAALPQLTAEAEIPAHAGSSPVPTTPAR